MSRQRRDSWYSSGGASLYASSSASISSGVTLGSRVIVHAGAVIYAVIEDTAGELRPRGWLGGMFAPEPPRFRVVRLTAGEPPTPGDSQ